MNNRDTRKPETIAPPEPLGIVRELLTTSEAAMLCNMGERTFWRHSHSGVAPAPVKIGDRLVRFRRSELLEWIDGGCKPVDARRRNER